MDENELALVDPPKRKKRGPAKLKEKPTEPFKVEFDKYGRAIGKHQNDWATYVGGMSRLRISIVDDDWSKIEQDQKDALWEIIKEYFDLTNNDHKDSTLTQCNHAWKRFKTHLKTKYIIPNKKPYERKEYSFIEEKDWEEFCRKHRSPQNMKKRAIGKVYAKQQTNYAHLGRSGYRGMDVDFTNVELDEALKEEVLNITCDRTRNWILARITSPNMEELFRKLVVVDKKMAQGQIPKEKGADPLIVVLGPEHGGRTRTVGNGIGFRKWVKGYKQIKRRNQGIEEIEAIVDRKLAQRDAERDKKRDAERDVARDAERDAKRDAVRDAAKDAEIEVERDVEREASNDGREQKRQKQSSCESTTVVHKENIKDIKEPKSCMLFSPYTEDSFAIARGMVYPIGNGPYMENHLYPIT